MNAFPQTVETLGGKTYRLAKQIGKGGEGAVFEPSEGGDIALKLYWPDKANSRQEKITTMASLGWHKSNPFVAFPIEVLFSKGKFVGFAMKKVGGHKPVHLLYSPASRKIEFGRKSFPFLIRSASNIARAVASVHATGCVIGDINESGFLISEKATSILIDSDSFQVSGPTKQFLCVVGKPDYTPPELRGARLDQVRRTPNHDNFGLAILIFQLLFMGKHPYAGRFLGKGDMPIEKAINEYRFAYSKQAAAYQMQPPPGAPVLSDYSEEVAQFFEQAFARSGPTSRPSAESWAAALRKLEGELQTCNADRSHHHLRGKPCPWCRLEKASPGFVAFGMDAPAILIPINVNAGQLRALLGAVRDPGPWLAFPTILVLPTGLSPTPPPSGLLDNLNFRSVGGAVAAASGALLISFGFMLWGVVALGSGLLANAVAPKQLKALRSARALASSAHNTVAESWQREATSSSFIDVKLEAHKLIDALEGLPAEERRGIQELEHKKRELQLRHHLERFVIRQAKIKKIGDGRKRTLASYNIETAADLERHALGKIPGFGPGLISELMAWRQVVVAKFVFNASEPLNPTDVSNLKLQIQMRKKDLEKKIRDKVSALNHLSASIQDQRTKLTASANQTLKVLKQAELDESAANGPLQKASKFISFCCAGIAVLGLSFAENNRGRIPQQSTTFSAPPSPAPSRTASPSASGSQPNPRGSSGTATAPTSSARSTSPSVPARPAIQQQQPSSSSGVEAKVPIPSIQWPPAPPPTRLPTFSPPTIATLNQLSTAPTNETNAPPLSAPVEVTPPSSPRSSEVQPLELLDLTKSADIATIQQRLIALGLLEGAADGKWGPKSRAALIEFRSRSNLRGDAAWDEVTQRALFSRTTPIQPLPTATFAFVGAWTPTVGDCDTDFETIPLRITPRAAIAQGGACQFSSVRADGDGSWMVIARCGNRPTTNIRLTVTDAGLHWKSERGDQFYYRCASGPPGAVR